MAGSKRSRSRKRTRAPLPHGHGVSDDRYAEAIRLLADVRHHEARALLGELRKADLTPDQMALVLNDLAALDAVAGDLDAAEAGLREALLTDPECQLARENLELLKPPVKLEQDGLTSKVARCGARRTRIAVLSLLFNWPSTGGGTIHTAEAVKFLTRAGYEVRHICAEFPAWGIGPLRHQPPVAPVVLQFDSENWNAAEIQRRFRQAVDDFSPDHVIITDSWSFKPLLAKAVEGYPFILRLAALESLCPLNNVRLLVNATGAISQCPRHQLATRERCRQCAATNGRMSGGLHQAERSLAGFDQPDYERLLRWAFAEAEAVLVVNPLIEAIVSPHARRVCVVPSGFDSARFPRPDRDPAAPANSRTVLLFAGLMHELMKGFHTLRAAGRRLWEKRQDFEIVVTSDPPEDIEPFEHYVS